MNPDLTAYREQLAAIRDDLYGALGNDDQAYAALQQGDDLQPYTAEAEQIWRDAWGLDLWRQHDLAILLHARAYDLEAVRDPDAERYWREALVHWAAVVADDGFWDGLAAHMDVVTGQRVDRATVAAVRARLPRDLLGVHVTLIEAYRSTDPDRARMHAHLLRQAPFDPEIAAGLRHGLVADVVAGVHPAVQAGRYADTIERLQTLLAFDDDNPELIRWLLHTVRAWNEQLCQEGNWTLIGRNLAAAVNAAKPLGGTAAADSGPLGAELARLEYWRGLTAVREVNDALDGDTAQAVRRRLRKTAAGAIDAFDRGLRLDPTLLVDAWYFDLPQFRAQAHLQCGVCELIEGAAIADPAKGRHCRKAAQHLRSSLGDNEDAPMAWLYLSDALLMPDDVPKNDLDEAAAAAARAETLIDTAAPELRPQLREHLDHVRQMLAFKRLRVGDVSALAYLLDQTRRGES